MESIIKLKAFSFVYFPGQTSIEEFIGAIKYLRDNFPLGSQYELETVFDIEERLRFNKNNKILDMRNDLADELCYLHEVYESS